MQSGEPYSLYEFYGAVGSINFGNFPTLMNPVLGIKDPKHPKSALDRQQGLLPRFGRQLHPSTSILRRSPSTTCQPGTDGIPVSTGSDPSDIYQTAFNVGQRNIFRQSPQKRLDLSVRKGFKITEKIRAQYELNVFNVTNTTSLDIPQDQAQIRQNNGCSATAITAYGGDNNCNQYRSYLGYGQIVTSNDPADQQSALGNLDQVPFSSGTGKSTQLPLQLSLNPPQGTCTLAALTIVSKDPHQQNCPNNAANFGSVTGTIGGSRAITMGFHITY